MRPIKPVGKVREVKSPPRNFQQMPISPEELSKRLPLVTVLLIPPKR
jgi:hypothetical protein